MSEFNERFLLENSLRRAILSLADHEINSLEYAKTLDRVVVLHKMLAEEKPRPMSRDTMAVVGANLLGIVLIIKHEFVNVVTSKAMSLLLKPKI